MADFSNSALRLKLQLVGREKLLCGSSTEAIFQHVSTTLRV